VPRISVIGTSGSGKTTLARHLAEQLDLPHLELDAVFHQPGWTGLPDEDFQATVRQFCAGDRWVVCGKYSQVRELVFEQADTIVCLDHGRLRQTQVHHSGHAEIVRLRGWRQVDAWRAAVDG
jgi:adenylate kinase family enzyme